jgi:hypothetical protein
VLALIVRADYDAIAINTPTTSISLYVFSFAGSADRLGHTAYLNYFYYSFFSMSMNSFVDFSRTRLPKLA